MGVSSVFSDSVLHVSPGASAETVSLAGAFVAQLSVCVSRSHAQCHGLPVASSSRSASLHFLAFRAPVPRASDQEMGFLSESHL